MAANRHIQRRTMNFISRLVDRFRRPLSSANTSQSMPIDAGSINDGVDYSQPVIVEGWRRAAYNGDQLREYVEANSREPFRNQFDTPYKTDLPFMPVTEDPLKEWSWQTRTRVLSNCHAAYERNPIGNAGVQYSADFIIGDGFNLNCKNTEVSDLLYAFVDDPDNAIREYERQAAIDLQVDGELFLRKFKGKVEDGTASQIRVIPMRPWECEYIKTEPGDFKTRISYHFQLDNNYGDDPIQPGGGEALEVPADEMIHAAINRHAYELRGRPDLYRILPWLRAYTEYLEGRARQNVWRNALIWWAKVVQGTADTIAKVSSAFAKPPAPGTVVVTSDRVELSALSGGGGAGDMEDGRAIKNMAITGLRMAEYMFADGSDANLATATAQQLPALTRFSAYQRTLIEQVWYPLFRSIVQTAIDEGVLPEEVEEQDPDGEPIHEEPTIDDAPKMKTVTPGAPDGTNPGMQMPVPNVPETPPKKIKTIDAFEISYEPVNADNPKDLSDMLQTAVTNEWASNETASSKLGFDYYYEQKKIKRERQENMKQQAAGLKPIPPDMMRPEGMPSNAEPGQQPPGQEQPGVAA
jgi:hypothetical protein